MWHWQSTNHTVNRVISTPTVTLLYHASFNVVCTLVHVSTSLFIADSTGECNPIHPLWPILPWMFHLKWSSCNTQTNFYYSIRICCAICQYSCFWDICKALQWIHHIHVNLLFQNRNGSTDYEQCTEHSYSIIQNFTLCRSL